MLVVSCWLELVSHPRAEIPTASLSLGDNPTPIPDSPDIIRACGSQVMFSCLIHNNLFVIDRFPRNFLSDIFTRATMSEDTLYAGICVLPRDGAGTRLNMATHEPEHRSYFHKLGRDDFPKKNTSHIDQNQLAISSRFPDVADGSVRSQLDSANAFVNDASKDATHVAGSVFVYLQSRYDLSQVKISESMQFVDMVENTRIPDSEYEVKLHQLIVIGINVFFFFFGVPDM
jgi:hypothetical protein